jgi:hypothetical protein
VRHFKCRAQSACAECDANMTQSEHHAHPRQDRLCRRRLAQLGAGADEPISRPIRGLWRRCVSTIPTMRRPSATHGSARAFAEVAAGRPATWRGVRDLGAALEGADLVVVSILPGTLRGHGGRHRHPRALRHLAGGGGHGGAGRLRPRAAGRCPMLLEIGRAIRAHAPDAFVCNLTNPMSVLTDALFRARSGHPRLGRVPRGDEAPPPGRLDRQPAGAGRGALTASATSRWTCSGSTTSPS